TPLLNIQLNSYDSMGNLVDALLLDSRFSYEDITRFAQFTLHSDNTITIDNYIIYLYEENKYGEPDGLINKPRPEHYSKEQYRIEQGHFKLVSHIKESEN